MDEAELRRIIREEIERAFRRVEADAAEASYASDIIESVALSKIQRVAESVADSIHHADDCHRVTGAYADRWCDDPENCNGA